MSTTHLRAVAVVLTAVALIPVGAHLLEMTNKLALPREDYLTVQAIYRGWALLGVVLLGALIANLALAVALRRDHAAAGLALVAALLIALSLVIFFVWVFPTNQATENWTTMPGDWKTLRAHWEYGHAVNALITFVALCAVTAAAVRHPANLP